MKRKAVVFRHILFEDLDSLHSVMSDFGFDVEYIDTPTAQNFQDATRKADLLIVLGGPIGVYQNEDFPFLDLEIALVRERLENGQAVVGICLGAQIMAKALGANVYPGAAGKEIGWTEINLTSSGRNSPLSALGSGQRVLHWHGDTFDLPNGCDLLASSDRYANQAFSFGKHGLALQFHLEASSKGLERWYVGNTAELAAEGIAITELRDTSAKETYRANTVLKVILAIYLYRLELVTRDDIQRRPDQLVLP